METIKRKGIHKALSLLVIVLMLFGIVIPQTAVKAEAFSIKTTIDGLTYSYTESGQAATENIHGMFSTNFGGGIAYCGEHGIAAPMGNTPGSSANLTATKYNDSLVAKVLFYGYGGPEQWSGFANSKYNSVYKMWSGNDATSKTQACGISVTSMALTRAYAHKGNWYNVSGLDAFWSYISGKSVPDGFTVYKLTGGNSAAQDLFTWEYNPKVNVAVKINKTSSNPDFTNGNSYYSLSGAQYQVSAGGDVVKTLTTNASGVASGTISILPDDAKSIKVKESKASPGYELDKKTYTVDGSSGSVTVNSVEPPQIVEVAININKTSSNPDISNGNDCYDLAGAQYQVIAGGRVIETLTTNADGKASGTVTLSPDQAKNIQIKEIKASPGYGLDAKVYTVDGSSGSVTINSKEPPQNDPANAIVYKIDSETHETWNAQNLPQGSSSLEGAEYTVKYYDGYYETEEELKNIEPTRSWILKTNENGFAGLDDDWLVSGDAFYLSSDGIPTFPLGTVTTQETKASEGYLVDDTLHIQQVTPEGTMELVETYQVPISKEQVRRGDLEFTKVDGTNQQRLANIPFLLTSASGEAHVIVTDENGYFNSSNSQAPHAQKTNANDAAWDGENVDESKLDPTAGVWFGSKDALSADKGALYYGEYTLTELPCKANEGLTLVRDIKVYVSREGYLVQLGTITDDNDMAELDTRLWDSDLERESTTLARPDVEFTDRVDYKRLNAGEEYRIVGTLVDKATSEPIKVDGKEVTAEKTFTADKQGGNVDIVYNFDASDLAGTSVVSFVKVYKGNTLIMSHENPSDLDQTMEFLNPIVDTVALDNGTGTHWAMADEEVTITDSIEFKDLIGQYIYEVKGTLIDKDTGKALQENGKDIFVTKKIEPNRGKGELEMEFTFDASDLEGKDVVVFQEFYFDGIKVAEHTDINDPDQTIHFPKIRTSAADSETEHRISYADDKVIIEDTVKYENVAPGVEHVVEGTLVEKETEAVITEGETTFTPQTKNGDVKVKFTFDASSLAGKDVVALQDLTMDGFLIGQHADINDIDQTVNLPKIETSAIDKDNENEFTLADDEATIVDTVKYTNVLVGEEYTSSASLIDRETEEVIATGEKEFTAEHSNGTVNVDITFDSSDYAGKDVVVFEKLLFEGHVVATHEDLDDVNQTVNIPKLKTKAIDKENKINVALADEEVTVIDTVEYTNVVKGYEYTLKGSLIDGKTEEVIAKAEGKFTAGDENGEEKMEFDFTGKDYEGKNVVVYEELYYDGKLIGVHKDLADLDQTVKLPKIRTEARAADTGARIALAGDDLEIIDAVKYENVVAGSEHTIKGQIINGETEEVIAKSEKTFTAKEENGSEDIKFTFDASSLAGKDVVVYEDLYFDGKLVGRHMDITDELQTIKLPKIKTKAIDSLTGNEFTLADDESKIIDTVSFENVLDGEEYTMQGTLVDETGESIVKTEKTFTAKEEDGEVKLEFNFDSSKYEGEKVVAFERLIYKGHVVAIHEDLSDKDQTVYIPRLSTSAADSETGLRMSLADEEVKIIDTVSYESVAPGKTYTIQGRLMDREAKEVIAEDEIKFTAEKEDGKAKVEFDFTGKDYAGKDVVAFEALFYDGKLIAYHTDYNDPDQTVKLPKLRTSAMDKETELKIANADNDITVVDTVDFENVYDGEEYTLKGSVLVKSTGKTIAKAENKFVAEGSDGSVDMELNVDGSKYDGESIVVFESLYFKGKLVAQHVNINDPDQTVKLPKLETAAKDKETGKQVVIHKDGKTITVADTVKYDNVIAGKEYKLSGKLMDKSTGKVLVNVEGKEITAEKTFEAAAEKGSVEMEFTLDISNLADKEIVAFETLYLDGNIVGQHEDINDKAQTIKIETPPVKTGDAIPPFVYIAAVLLLVAAATTVIVIKTKRNTVK